MKKYFFLEDIKVLEESIKDLRSKIKELGKEQAEAVKQSTEIFGHDDACQEAIYQERRVVSSRLEELTQIFNNSVVVNPSDSYEVVRIGATVKLSDGRTLRVGSYMVLADYPIANISYNSPLGKLLLGKTGGDEIEFKGQILMITNVI